jgi:anti-sigma B factor antagonist
MKAPISDREFASTEGPAGRIDSRPVEQGSVFAAAVERPTRNTVVVKATGELDLMTVPELEGLLREVMAEKADLELDLSRLDFIDSTGVHLVLTAHEASVREGWTFTISGAGNEVRRAFELLGLLDHLQFRDPGQTAS